MFNNIYGDEIEKIMEINPLTGKVIATREHVMIFPNSKEKKVI